jgi:protein TonB
MSNRTSPAPDSEKTSSDWLPAAPSLHIRWLACIVLVVPALVAAGVYWLNRVPTRPGPRASDAVIEVRLLTSQRRVDERQEVIRPSPKSEPLTEDPAPPAPDAIAKLTSSKPASSVSSGDTSSAASSGGPVQTPTNRQALLFQKALLTHIARYRRYPEEARRDGLQGTVQVLFAMRRDGAVTDVWIRTSSGQSVLDAAAADAIRRAQPLPRIPSELPDRLTILVPVTFDIP